MLFNVKLWLLGDQHANHGFGLDGNLYELPGQEILLGALLLLLWHDEGKLCCVIFTLHWL